MVGDIDRGGVIAAVVGTGAVLEAADRALIAGFLISKLRGNPALLEDWGPHHRAPHRLALLRRDSMGAGGGAPSGRGRGVAAADRPFAAADGCGSPPRRCRVWRTMTMPTRCAWSRTWASSSCRLDG